LQPPEVVSYAHLATSTSEGKTGFVADHDDILLDARLNIGEGKKSIDDTSWPVPDSSFAQMSSS